MDLPVTLASADSEDQREQEVADLNIDIIGCGKLSKERDGNRAGVVHRSLMPDSAEQVTYGPIRGSAATRNVMQQPGKVVGWTECVPAFRPIDLFDSLEHGPSIAVPIDPHAAGSITYSWRTPEKAPITKSGTRTHIRPNGAYRHCCARYVGRPVMVMAPRNWLFR